jgi:hypothetical protein
MGRPGGRREKTLTPSGARSFPIYGGGMSSRPVRKLVLVFYLTPAPMVNPRKRRQSPHAGMRTATLNLVADVRRPEISSETL